jgi:signal transduction histidine kinase
MDDRELDTRIAQYLDALEQLKQGDFSIERPGPDALGQAILDLARHLERQHREQHQLDQIVARINAGLLLDDVLDNVYEDFRELIPYNRIGFSLIENDGQTVRARWAKSDRTIRLRRGYDAPLVGSSLEPILRTQEPRILNDLEAYLRQKPESESTRLIVEEGMRSSLTCPLIANGVAVGFIFFSSLDPYAYENQHIDVFQRIAAKLSIMVEKGRLVSELAAQKHAIERQNQELLKLNELKNTFLGIAAHDLRSPLGAIDMAVNFLLDPSVELEEADEEKILRDVAVQATHMLNLINELLDVAQIESGRLDLDRIPLDLSQFLAEAVQRHVQMAARKGMRVLLDEFAAGLVQADALRLRQVIDNLISNAIKFSPQGSTVRVWAEEVAGGWTINVQDEGPGIQPEERQRLFQDFARLSARPTGGERSTGLGLAISKRVVEAHGGRIGVDSEPGQGATFWFTLPAN